jgi:hypothetical protein
VAVAGAHAILFQAGLAERLPSTLDWRAAAALVTRDARPGDATLVSPPWAERARSALPSAVPVLPVRRAVAGDLVGVRRVWLLSLPGAPGFTQRFAADLSARSVAVDGPQRLGALEVSLYTIAAPTLPLAYLPDLLAGAEVRLGETPCPAGPSRAFGCPGSTARVAREVRELDAVARPCIAAASDPGAGADLVLTFLALPVGRVLRGHAAAVAPGAAVRLVVSIDGEEVGTVEVPGAGSGRPFQLDTARFAGGLRSLSFALAGAGPATPTLCVEAMTLP